MGRFIALVFATVSLAAPATTYAYGWIVRPDEAPLEPATSFVVLARHDGRTALTIRPAPRGAPEPFAVLLPVPGEPEDTEHFVTLHPYAYEYVERHTAPALYHYYEIDPCTAPGMGGMPREGVTVFDNPFRRPPRPLRRYGIEARRAAPTNARRTGWVEDGSGYEITLLSASQSRTPGAWLASHGFRVSDELEAAVRPHVEAGRRFLVARASAEHAEAPPPLRFVFRSERFTLPLDAAAGDARDLTLVVVGDTRWEAADRPNVTTPTSVRVDDPVEGGFDAFYEAVRDALLARNEGAVVTELAEHRYWNDYDDWLGGRVTWPLAGPLLQPMAQVDPTMPVTVLPDRVRVEGAIDEERLVSELAERTDSLAEECGGLSEAPVAMTLDFTIGADGGVRRTTPGPRTPRYGPEPEYAAPYLVGCLHGVVEGWTFTPPERGEARVRAWLAPPADERWFGAPLLLTRLYLRLSSGPGELALRPADPIEGGLLLRPADSRSSDPEERRPTVLGGAEPAYQDRFQTRFFIGHEWEEHIACGPAAVREQWVVGRPDEPAERPPLDEIVLEELLRQDVPELGVTARHGSDITPEEPPTELEPLEEEPEDEGCGCRVGARGAAPHAAPLLALLLLLWRRR